MAYEMQIRGESGQSQDPQSLGGGAAAAHHARHLPPGLVVPDQPRAARLRQGQGLRPRPEPDQLAARPLPRRADHRAGADHLLARRPSASWAPPASPAQEPLNGWIAIILYLLIAPALWAYVQVELNKVWQAEADPIEGELAPPAPADPLPPPLPEQPQATEPPGRRSAAGGADGLNRLVKQRVSLITLGVGDLGRARRFYEALGWTTGAAPEDDVVFFQAGEMVVALWDRARLAEDSASRTAAAGAV